MSGPAYLIHKPQPTAGSIYLTESFRIECARRPRWLHRVMMRALLGWRWEDAK